MLIHWTRTSLFALTTSALLLSTATAQNGTRSSETARDPFVNQHSSAALTTNTHRPTPAPPTVTPQQISKADPQIDQGSGSRVIPMVPSPEVTVTGIVTTPGNRHAILRAGSSSIIVTEGQRLSDYQVKSIDATSVTFSAAGQDFRVSLAQ